MLTAACPDFYILTFFAPESEYNSPPFFFTQIERCSHLRHVWGQACIWAFMCIKNGDQPSVSFSGMLFTSFRKESHRLGKIPPVFVFTAMFIFESINELQVYATRTGFLGEFRGLNLSPQDAKPVLLQLSRTPPSPPPNILSQFPSLVGSCISYTILKNPGNCPGWQRPVSSSTWMSVS